MKSKPSQWLNMTTNVLWGQRCGFAVVLCSSNVVSENHNLQWANNLQIKICWLPFLKNKAQKMWTQIIKTVTGTQEEQRVELLQPRAINNCMLAGHRPPQKMIFGYGTIQVCWWSYKRPIQHELWDHDLVVNSMPRMLCNGRQRPALFRLRGDGKQRRYKSLPILLCSLCRWGWALAILVHSPKPKNI